MSTAAIANRVYDGEKFFPFGVDSLDHPSKLRPGRVSWAFNCVMRGDEIRTRPSFRSLFRFNTGTAQGMTVFTPASGIPYLVFAVSGSIYASAYPFTSAQQLPNISFSGFVDHIVFKEALVAVDDNGDTITPYSVLMMQDGRSRAAFWDGSTSRHLNPAVGETPVGLWMEFIGSRLWVTNGRQLLASDIYNPLKFTENQYIAEGGSFLALDGQTISGLKRTADAKQLLIFTQNNTDRLQAGITDRTLWKNYPDFIATLFPGVGLVGGKGIVDHNGALHWMSKEGARIYSAVGDSVKDVRRAISSQEMDRSFKNRSPCMHRSAAWSFGDYVGFSIPSGDIKNRHTWALDGSSQDKLDSDYPMAWQGVWTGIFPVEWASGFILDRNRIFCISNDPDCPRVWEAFIEDDKGDNGCPIECFVELRGHNFAKAGAVQPIDQSLSLKRYLFSEVHSRILGEVTLALDYRTEFSCWKQVGSWNLSANRCGTFGCMPFSKPRIQARYLRSQEPKKECGEGGSPFQIHIGTMIQHRLRWRGFHFLRQYKVTAEDFQEKASGSCEFGDTTTPSLDCCDGEPNYIACTNDGPSPYYYGADNPPYYGGGGGPPTPPVGQVYALAGRNGTYDVNATDSNPQGFWQDVGDINQSRTLGLMQNLSNDQADWTWNVSLEAGSYIMAVCFNAANDRGIIEVLLDGVSLGTVDTYSSIVPPVPGYNDVATINVTVPTTGIHVLTMRGTGTKNPASSNFNLYIEYIEFNTVFVQALRSNPDTINPAWSDVNDSSQIVTGGYLQNVANDQNTVEWTVNLPAGTYNWRVQWQGNADRGIAEALLDGVLFATVDTYYDNSGISGRNYNHSTVGTMTVPTSGNHTLVLKGNGTKNPLSSNFFLLIEFIQFSK